MRAKKKQPENPEKSIANTMGNAVRSWRKQWDNCPPINSRK